MAIPFLTSVAQTANSTAVTPALGDNSTKIATTAFVKGQGYSTSSTVGATGPQGIQGNTGTTGAIGATGAQGNTGTANMDAPVFTTSMTLGATIFKSYTFTTSSTVSQTLVSIPQAIYRSVEFIIEGEDAVGSKFHMTKISAISRGATVDYSEFGSVQIGSVVGSFSVAADGTNMILSVIPASSNSTVFKVAVILISV